MVTGDGSNRCCGLARWIAMVSPVPRSEEGYPLPVPIDSQLGDASCYNRMVAETVLAG